MRRHLQGAGETLAKLYPGNPKRATARPTAEMMLRTFEGVTLTVIEHAGESRTYLTPLSSMQPCLVRLLGLAPDIYWCLAQHSSKLLLKMSEP